jgi:mannose/cellobiose epimerase-like protein (N-acyl-D-glucosamine 2-epimerase family)
MYQRQQVEQWMFQHALPFWLARGFETESGTFREALNFDGSDANVAYRRTRVACRQIYVYSHAATLGWNEGLPAATQCAEWLTKHAWRADERGFVRRMSKDSAVADATIDLYDNAFAVFAFAWLHHATGSAWTREWAKKTLEAITTHWPHPSGEGYWHDETGALPRQQNPHMHLMEACLMAHQACGDSLYLETAHQLAELFHSRFHDGTTLAEFFDHNLQRMPDKSGRHIEPGHMLEWSWILGEYGRASGTDQREAITSLINWAERHGVDHATGITYNVVQDDGTPLDRGSRTWPNTERLKAAVVAHRMNISLDGVDARTMAKQAVDVLLSRYLATDTKGGWIDHISHDGSVIAANMPTSTLYHVFLAFAEAVGTEGLLD